MKSILPEFKWQIQSEANIYNMHVFSLYSTIFMVNIRTRVPELDSKLSKISRKTSKLPSPICLHSFDIVIQ